jgi:hypothetical protein
MTVRECAGQINVNIECSSLKCEPNDIHHNIINSEVYNDNLIEI